MTSNSEKKEKSLAEFVVIVALVGVLMAIFINFFNKNEAQFTQAGFTAVAQSFSTKVNTVHAQWLMDRQPNMVYLASLNSKTKQAIPVNKAGWIDVNEKQLACEKIWLLVMEVPISKMSYPISIIEMNILDDEKLRENNHSNTECRYVLQDGSYFQYNRTKGQVNKEIK